MTVSDCEPKFRNGSFSEYLTLDTLGSGDERKAELIWRLIYSVFISQFGQERPFVTLKPKQK
jgi:hypothetical protein